MRKQLSKLERLATCSIGCWSCLWAQLAQACSLLALPAPRARALLVVLAAVAPLHLHAQVWGFIDDKGVAHFANEKLDSRYELFFRPATLPQIKPGALPQALGGAGKSAPLVPAAGAQAATLGANNAASAPPKFAAFFEVSTGYKAVRHLLRDAAKRNDLDYDLLKALIVTESGFDAQAVSPKGAVGLMQLMPPTAARYGVRPDPKRGVTHKLIDPATNIAAGSRYLRDLLKLFPGRLDLALAAYNAGEGSVQRFGNQIPPYKETQNYVVTVLQLYTFLKPPGFNTAGLLPTPWPPATGSPSGWPPATGSPSGLPPAAGSPSGLPPIAGASASRPVALAQAAGSAPRVRVELPAPGAAQALPAGAIPGRGNMPAAASAVKEPLSASALRSASAPTNAPTNASTGSGSSASPERSAPDTATSTQ